MSVDFLIVQFLGGLASASSLFLVAAGLSIIFGVTRVVNFAHGTLFMIGAYLAYTLAETLGLGFWPALLLAPLAVGGLGALIEIGLLRRIYRAPELFQLVATFALVLIASDVVPMIWGPEDLLGPRAPGLGGAVSVMGRAVPEYDLFLIALGPLVLGALWLVFTRTRWGLLVRAATEDREMVAALGTDQRWLFTGVFALGALLAGLGGALALPREAIGHGMDAGVIVQAFVVVVVGGMGSVPGAYLAAVLLGLVNAFGVAFFPQGTLVTMGLVMGAVLIVRPRGLLGRIESEGGVSAVGPGPRLRPASGKGRLLWGLGVVLVLAAPRFLDAYGLSLLCEALILALSASALQLLMGTGGMVSFGHGAFFGLGAYGTAVAVVQGGLSLPIALACAPLAGGLGGLLVGWLISRLSGVYLAMLTLAFAEIIHALAIQAVGVTGGDNGLIGVWPPPWAGDPAVFAWLVMAICLPALFGLRALALGEFGRRLRALRDARSRAEASGIAAARLHALTFAIVGAGAGLAGGLFAFLKGSVFPAITAIPTSVDALVMVLLGGLHALAGPLVGAFLYLGLESVVAARTDLWQLVVGLVVLGLVLVFPQGVAGAAGRLARRGRPQ
ncbi:inner-membrane translocator [Rhodospirillum rubrum ATCC 11170]|uniref:Inner-membrane translocator n=1 Tax=Rhodospirillum rubrum (strain ATCC 11170 / ATH 1.1.1 / DSM 467 / LMG 4362 / NCIMB 8255 / S1) TaxID=269796 RepID=Q2RWV7_RHORT|nr:ABC transporter permease [Rhodospirillum rubrum]ABC21388.1 inner-membrane translocator [Rhodospirillum rubrum ATCC 11170]MBK5952981.1 ABC transporter permease [Rhodospirillum rubrum]QXG81066.1 ABC transporter permease [Rhodospirillum rubrum]HCF17129.1 ABC transporter permease [Rhodospirillum rubrum]